MSSGTSIQPQRASTVRQGRGNFNPLVDAEYQSYTLIYRHPQVRELFEKTAKDHFSSLEIREKLYNRSGLSRADYGKILSSILEPEYKAALNSGFRLWH